MIWFSGNRSGLHLCANFPRSSQGGNGGVNKSSIFWERFVFNPKSGIVWGLLASTGNQLWSQRLQHPDLVAAWSLWLLPGTVLGSDGAKCQIPHVLADLVDVW
jgi:hypothetical protein